MILLFIFLQPGTTQMILLLYLLTAWDNTNDIIIFLQPDEDFRSKALVFDCFLVFRRIGEYISLDQFYNVHNYYTHGIANRSRGSSFASGTRETRSTTLSLGSRHSGGPGRSLQTHGHVHSVGGRWFESSS